VGALFAGSLFVGMLVLLEVGRRIGLRHLAIDAEGARAGVGAVEGAVFALLGLLVAFTFSGAATRLDTRRLQIVDEANAIGTAYLRIDLLPATGQPAMRERFKKYVDLRLEVYRRLPDIGASKQALAQSAVLQGEIWGQAVAGCRTESPPCATLLLPALNQMIDITTTRTVAARIHPPWIVFGLLFGLALLASMMAGYDMAGARTRSWVHAVGFALIMTVSVYVILDLEFPRFGLIRIDTYDQVLTELRESMK
jgi:hypothetical protein